MRVAIGTDHRGVEYKKEIINALGDKYEFIDCSPHNFDTDDYPDFAFIVGEKVINEEADAGVLLCGTGIGMSIAANKVKGIRCALVHTKEEALLAKEHNNANVVAIGTNDNNIEKICELICAFLDTKHESNEKHDKRVNKIIEYEDGEYYEL